MALSNPSVSSVVLSTASGQNLSSEDLLVSFFAENSTTNITDWRSSGVSIAKLNLAFDSNLSSGSLRDYSTFQKNATIFGSPTWISRNGFVGGAYSFDEGTEYLKVDQNTSVFNLSKSFTVYFLAKKNGNQLATFSGILSTVDTISTNAKALGIWVNGLNLRVSVGNGTADRDFYCNNLFGNTNVHFIAFSYNSLNNNYLLYADGSICTEGTYAIVPSGTNSGWFIGRASSSYPFNGSIDNIVILDRSISKTALDSIYSQVGAEKNLVNLSNEITLNGENYTVAITPNNLSADGVTILSNFLYTNPVFPTALADLSSLNIYDLDGSNASAYCYNKDVNSVQFYWEVLKNGVSFISGYDSNLYSQYSGANVVNISSTDFSIGDNLTLVCKPTDLIVNGSASASLIMRSPNDYYVSLTGNDSTGDGSSASPWNTIDYALSRVQDRDSIILKDGEYNLNKNWQQEALTIYKAVNLQSENIQGAKIKINSSLPYSVIFWTDSAGGSLEGLVINSTGNLANSSYAIRASSNISDFTIKNSLFEGAKNYSLYLDNSKNWSIENNTFFMDSFTNSIIYLSSTNNISIINNTFGSTSRRINGTGCYAIYASSNNNRSLIKDNNFYFGIGNAVIYFTQSTLNTSNDIVIDRNYLNLSSNLLSYTIGLGTEASNSGTTIGGIRNATVKNNYIIAEDDGLSPNHGLFMGFTYNSYLINNTVINTRYNYVIKGNTNITVENCSSINAGVYGMYDKASWNSLFKNNYFSLGSYPSISVNPGDLLRNISINSTWVNNFYLEEPSSFDLGNGDAIVINSTHTTEIVGATANLTKKWYYQAYVVDSQNNPVQNAIVSISNSSGLVISSLTGANGYSDLFDLMEYFREGPTFTYSSNYTINVSYIGQESLYNTYNASLQKSSLNNIFNFTFFLPINIISPQNTSYNNRTQLLNISSDGNSTLYNWNGTNYTYSSPINVTFTEGINTLVVYSNDSLGAFNSSNVTFYIDSIVPNITLVSPINSYSETSSSSTLNFQFNVSDESDISNCTLYLNGVSYSNTSIVNKSSTNTISASVIPGSYSWYVNCTDSLGNIGNSSNNTLTIVMPEEVQANSGGGSPTLYASVENLITGYNKVLFPHWQVKFNIGSVSHSLYLNNVSNNSATITVSSTPQVITLKIGEEKKLSLTNSSYYDLYVKLNSIYQSKANFTIKTINEKIFVENQSIQETNEDVSQIIKEEKSSFVWAWILVLVLIVIVGIFILLKKHKK